MFNHTHRYTELDGEHDVNFKMLHNNSTTVSHSQAPLAQSLQYAIISSGCGQLIAISWEFDCMGSIDWKG